MKLIFAVFVMLASGSISAQDTGPLPRPGSLEDVLACAGANEMLWTTEIKVDPYSRTAHDARQKASWYAAVALYIFQVNSGNVTRAVRDAQAKEPRSEVRSMALRCQPPPDSWRN